MEKKPTGKSAEDSFWADKTPCWELRGCVSPARRSCKAYRNPSVPCWEQETLCRELLGFDTCSQCEVCRLYGSSRVGNESSRM